MYAIVACQMEFGQYPMDTQICPIFIESFSYNSNKMVLKWTSSGVTVDPELKLLQYNILPLIVNDKIVYTADKNGNFSRLSVAVRFERQIGHHLIQTFAPSSLVVVLSWFSFWLGLDAIPGRVTLLVTCLLTLVTMFTGLRSDIPAVAYIKAIDVWMAGCMLSVFGALGEFVIVKVLDGQYLKLKKKQNMLMGETPWVNNKSFSTAKEPLIPLYWRNNKGKEKVLWYQIDRISRIIFPVVFTIFTTFYWITLIFQKNKSHI